MLYIYETALYPLIPIHMRFIWSTVLASFISSCGLAATPRASGEYSSVTYTVYIHLLFAVPFGSACVYVLVYQNMALEAYKCVCLYRRSR